MTVKDESDILDNPESQSLRPIIETFGSVLFVHNENTTFYYHFTGMVDKEV